jgi:hypothetical protein
MSVGFYSWHSCPLEKVLLNIDKTVKIIIDWCDDEPYHVTLLKAKTYNNCGEQTAPVAPDVPLMNTETWSTEQGRALCVVTLCCSLEITCCFSSGACS